MPKGEQRPTRSWCESYTRTEGHMAAAMADSYGMPPHPWQRSVLNDWLAIADDGTLLNDTCLLHVPRQNGKTGVSDPRCTWGLVSRGEWILYTAQEFQTAKKAFDRMRAKFGDCRNDPRAKYPELNRMVLRYTMGANQMVLDLVNGGHIEFRTRGSGTNVARGGTFDLVVIDEAQSYSEAQEASMGALNSAAPSGSPQTIYMGTVPDPEHPEQGEVFANLRAAIVRNPQQGQCLHEWGADYVGDVTDRSRWYEYNPSLGFQLLERGLAKDCATMKPETFAREHLGWWPPTMGSAGVIPPKAWDACATDEPPTEGVTCFAVKFSPDGAHGCIAACMRPYDGGPEHIEVAFESSLGHGVGPFADWVMDVSGYAAQVVVDGQGDAAALVERLNDGGIEPGLVIKAGTRDAIAANAMLLSAVKSREVTHYCQDSLTRSATKTKRRRIGRDGGWGFQQTDEADAIQAEAAALALWAARTTNRDPSMVQTIG